MKFKKEIIHKLTKIDKKKKKHSSFFLPEHQRWNRNLLFKISLFFAEKNLSEKFAFFSNLNEIFISFEKQLKIRWGKVSSI